MYIYVYMKRHETILATTEKRFLPYEKAIKDFLIQLCFAIIYLDLVVPVLAFLF